MDLICNDVKKQKWRHSLGDFCTKNILNASNLLSLIQMKKSVYEFCEMY